MTTLEAIQLRRADEQVRAERLGGYWERDSWDVPRSRIAPEKPRRRPCLAGDCDRRVRSGGYCHMHGRRLARGLPVDWSESDPGRRPAGALSRGGTT